MADYLEFAELLCEDALHRTESCGGHFREESQTEEGEALRDDENFSFVSAWEFKGVGEKPVLHKEELTYEEIAEVLDLTVPAIKSLLFRARTELRARLMKYLSG